MADKLPLYEVVEHWFQQDRDGEACPPLLEYLEEHGYDLTGWQQ